jgi:hypothetical protein
MARSASLFARPGLPDGDMLILNSFKWGIFSAREKPCGFHQRKAPDFSYAPTKI